MSLKFAFHFNNHSILFHPFFRCMLPSEKRCHSVYWFVYRTRSPFSNDVSSVDPLLQLENLDLADDLALFFT